MTYTPKALLLAGLVLASVTVHAATFCVGDGAALAAALNIADNNQQSDEILIQQGTIAGNFLYTANAGETGDLIVRGGYDANCTATTGRPEDTVLDGGGLGRTLVLSGRDNTNLVVQGITVRGGLGTTQGGGLDVDRWVTATVRDTVLANNATAAGQDGSAGLEIDRTQSIVLIDNVLTANAGGNGGGASLSDFQNARIERNVFRGNTATDSGGALDVTSTGLVTMANNLFAGNQADGDGGAVSLRLEQDVGIGTLQATNNTFVANTVSGEGGALDLDLTGDAVTMALANNLFWANTASLAADMNIDNDDDRNGVAAGVTLDHNNFHHAFLAGFWSRIAIAIPASNFNLVDPLFASNTDFRLTPASPMIDAGLSTAPAVGNRDVDGALRVQGPSVDIGAFEAAADSDGDGVADSDDNCTTVANGDQRDSNGDGYGNVCDADLNNDGIVNVVDLGLLRSVFFSADADADFNGDGIVNIIDLGTLRALFLSPPGPSGVAP